MKQATSTLQAGTEWPSILTREEIFRAGFYAGASWNMYSMEPSSEGAWKMAYEYWKKRAMEAQRET